MCQVDLDTILESTNGGTLDQKTNTITITTHHMAVERRIMSDGREEQRQKYGNRRTMSLLGSIQLHPQLGKFKSLVCLREDKRGHMKAD